MKIIVIVGPTGVGKTKLSIELAKKLNGEIINGDSTQVFRELDIATAKVTNEEAEGIVHHLIDIKDISEDYSVFDYQIDCRNKIDEIIRNGKTPIIVGGTGHYIKSALYNYSFDEDYLIDEFNQLTDLELYNLLLKVDPNNQIHANNRKRVVRAYNYFLNFNKPFSQKEKSEILLYDAIFIGLTTNRDVLYNKINSRVDKMVADGLIEEALLIYNKNIRTKAVTTPIGYTELFSYFEGNNSLEEVLDLIRQKSRKYAKRQYTYFNNQLPINWFNVDYGNFSNTIDEVNKFIEEL